MAEFERALIQERVRAGLRNARAKGKHIGRPRSLWMDIKLQPYGRPVILGAKSVTKRGCPKERLSGRTIHRKALLACPKLVAAYPRAFECHLLLNACASRWRRDAFPKSYDVGLLTFLVRSTSFHDSYSMRDRLWATACRCQADPRLGSTCGFPSIPTVDSIPVARSVNPVGAVAFNGLGVAPCFRHNENSGKKIGAVITMNPYVAAAKFVMEKQAPEKTVKKTASDIAKEVESHMR